jgi:hypothetical protein
MQANSHNQAIPETVITAMEAAVNAQLEALTSYATPLTADDRKNLLKTGPKTAPLCAVKTFYEAPATDGARTVFFNL